jgi:hypothetical protein
VTTHPQPHPEPRPILAPFPDPGPTVQHAYKELSLATNGTPDQKKALGPPALLPRPWDPTTCRGLRLRADLWQWLDQVATWLNQEYSWDTDTLIPACWPLHPHLVHEIAVVADQRRRAGLALTSDALEEWHRYCLSAFTDRIRARLRAHCDEDHRPWPGLHRHREHLDDKHTKKRNDTYNADVATLAARRDQDTSPDGPPRLSLVDLDTGELHDD